LLADIALFLYRLGSLPSARQNMARRIVNRTFLQDAFSHGLERKGAAYRQQSA
jgi:hypothetical protein